MQSFFVSLFRNTPFYLSGKSMCYGCLPYAFDELAANSFKDSSTNAEPSAIVLIVSPLTALMEDQVKKFTRTWV